MRPTAFGPAEAASPKLTVSPTFIEDMGDERHILYDIDAPPVDTEATRAAHHGRSTDDALLVANDKRAQFTIRLPADVPATIGKPLIVSVDARRLYFFDPKTGIALR
jgi:hypothetical protein